MCIINLKIYSYCIKRRSHMKETKTMQVSPSNEDRCIREYQCFGWELLSSQEIKTKDSHLENWGGTIFSVTESEHYVKLVFTRDDHIPHIEELKKYQKQYESAIQSMEKEPKVRVPLAIILMFFWIFPGVLYIIFTNKKRKKIQQANNQKANIAQAALNSAKKLLV